LSTSDHAILGHGGREAIDGELRGQWLLCPQRLPQWRRSGPLRVLETCQRSDTDEDLTPADTLTVLARGHNPNQELGYLVVEARDPETNRPIDYDFLIGSALVVNSEFDFQWAYTPFAFEGLPLGLPPLAGASDCDHPFIEAAGTDSAAFQDFNGLEYSFFPDVLLLDQFFGEGVPGGSPVAFGNRLFLMSTDPGDTDIFLVGYNNNERRFSRTFGFDCYLATSLGELTQAVTQQNLASGSDGAELQGISTGWLKLQSTNSTGHGILGVFRQETTIGGSPFISGRELQFQGARVARLPRTQ
jgi:hypothetical protein